MATAKIESFHFVKSKGLGRGARRRVKKHNRNLVFSQFNHSAVKTDRGRSPEQQTFSQGNEEQKNDQKGIDEKCKVTALSKRVEHMGFNDRLTKRLIGNEIKTAGDILSYTKLEMGKDFVRGKHLHFQKRTIETIDKALKNLGINDWS